MVLSGLWQNNAGVQGDNRRGGFPSIPTHKQLTDKRKGDISFQCCESQQQRREEKWKDVGASQEHPNFYYLKKGHIYVIPLLGMYGVEMAPLGMSSYTFWILIGHGSFKALIFINPKLKGVKIFSRYLPIKKLSRSKWTSHYYYCMRWTT